MISTEQIKQTIEDCGKAGHTICVRDIAYVSMCKSFEDKTLVYKCLFGADRDFNLDYAVNYDQTLSMEYLRSYIDVTFGDSTTTKKKRRKNGDGDEDISFEENKAEIIRLIKQTREALEKKEIEAKDALKIEADLRVKLNDKFAVQNETKDQIVIVNAKYDAICPRCGVEVARKPISKEEAMDLYDLIDREEN